MTLLVVYEAGIAATYEDISGRVRSFQLDVTQNAEEGSVALSTITIDDPDGDYEIKGYRRIGIYETEATEGVDALTYHGFIVDRKVIRGPYDKTSPGRQWVCSVMDTNSYIEMRLMVGSDSNRPAETDVERVLWLISTSEMNRIADSTDYINTSGPVNMDAADYRGQRAADILNDCAQASGKNYYAFALDGVTLPPPYVDSRHLWYDWADSVERTSVIRLSNDLADIDWDETFPLGDDTELERDPSRIYSGVIVNFDGGSEYEEDLGISAEFTRRDTVAPAENIKTSAKATARALRYLADMTSEEDRITASVFLPAAKVNLIREGMRLPFKATHFPEEYHEFTWQRVLRRTVKQVTPEYYLLTMTLGTGPSWPPAEVAVPGEGSFYVGQDNVFWPDSSRIYVNGTEVIFAAGHDADDLNDRLAIPDGVLLSGENVIAVGILNGNSPATWGGNPTGLILRAYLGVDDSGPAIAFTSSATKLWNVENNGGTLGGEPSGWQDLVFDDSGWEAAGESGDETFGFGNSYNIAFPPTSPAMWISPEEAYDGGVFDEFGQDLIWLVRIHFTI